MRYPALLIPWIYVCILWSYYYSLQLQKNDMTMKDLRIFIQALCLCLFCFMAASSASSQHSSGSKTDWGAVSRSALIGAGAGHEGYDYIGNVSSKFKAEELASSKGYSQYIWDTNSGNVYAK